MPTENYSAENEYTLRADSQTIDYSRGGVEKCSSCSRIFNFLAGKATTIHRDWMSEGRGGDAGGTSSLATHVETEYFADMPSLDEVQFMYEKLKTLGGKPQPWAEIEKKSLPFSERNTSFIKRVSKP